MAITEFKFYHYDPSMVAAIIFIALFLTTTFLHTYQLLRTKAWFMIPLIIGGFCASPPPPGFPTTIPLTILPA